MTITNNKKSEIWQKISNVNKTGRRANTVGKQHQQSFNAGLPQTLICEKCSIDEVQYSKALNKMRYACIISNKINGRLTNYTLNSFETEGANSVKQQGNIFF